MGINGHTPPVQHRGVAVAHHRRKSPIVEAWLHAGRVIFLRKLGSTAAAEVLRRDHDRGQGVWWEVNATHPWRSRDAVSHHRRDALTVTAGERRVTCSRQRWAKRGPAWLAETDSEGVVSVKV